MADTRNKTKTPEPWLDPHAEAYIRIDNVTKRFGLSLIHISEPTRPY